MATARASQPPDPPDPTAAVEGDIPEEEWLDDPCQPPLKKGRKVRKSSPAWPFFQVRGKVNKERADLVRCKLCQVEIRRGDLTKGGRALTTTGMLQHLYRHHWRQTDSVFRALTRPAKRALCGPGADTSDDEPQPAGESSDEEAPPDSATATAPAVSPTAPLPGYVMVRNTGWSTVFVNCATCGQCLASREPDVVRLAAAVAQHVCPQQH